MKVLVTGNQGFVGKHLTKKLEQEGHTVFGLDIKNGMQEDVRTPEVLSNTPKCDIVIHLAANCSNPLSMKNPTWDAETNIMGTIKVLEYCRKHNVPIIFYSTCRVLTDDNESLWLDYTEASHSSYQDMRPPYGLSKLTAEKYIQLYAALWGVKYFILRPGTIYGPGQDGTEEAGWVYHFVNKAIKKEPITVFGDGNQTRDVVHVKDMVDLTIKMMDKLVDPAYDGRYMNNYFVGGGQSNVVSLNTIVKFLGIENVTYGPARTPDLYHYVSKDQFYLKRDFGWEPTINWIDGLREVIEDVKNGKN